METERKINVYSVGLINKILNARAVPISVIKVDAIISLPISVLDRPVSTRTEYTTAKDVVDNDVPAISDAW